MVKENIISNDYKVIPVGNGLVALVDELDYEELIKYKWRPVYNRNSSVCYAIRNAYVNGKVTTVKMHRSITNAPEGLVVDHINHNTLDNRRINLRVVTYLDNARNTRKLRNNTSGYCGVWAQKSKKSVTWRASITVNNKTVHLGRYEKKEDAIKARMQANIKYGFHENHGAC